MKMRMMIVALFIGAMIGCSRDVNDKENAVNQQYTNKPEGLSPGLAVRDNPYDSSGIRHNLVLEDLRNYQKETGDTTKQGMRDFLNKEFFSRMGYMQGIDFDRVDAMLNG